MKAVGNIPNKLYRHLIDSTLLNIDYKTKLGGKGVLEFNPFGK